MKQKTSDLQGPALDWAVAKCEFPNMNVAHFNHLRSLHVLHRSFFYSTDWSQGGPIIERERMTLTCVSRQGGVEWIADDEVSNVVNGPTPLIAAMRCFVASKLGDEVEVPAELA